MADDYTFPGDLRDAQARLHEVRAEYGALCRELPWSAAPLPGWEDDRRHPGYRSSRPDSPGYTPDQAAEVDRLHAQMLDLAQLIVTHKHWKGLSGPTLVKARTALKHGAAIPAGDGG
ncbi:hypothetical protein [Streptomyces yaizuensis]|uniref:Nucleic acid-binding protein n=1 Tax=Streptomyces yaizuensis TaxID=2989713 RepID=A0AA86JBH2_9ACTN|nr:hypothetical protein [Streptomyces sp. YSPA8]BDT39483.1 nucleic acid-binding protein [Streptomyces sp. YSPA8]